MAAGTLICRLSPTAAALPSAGFAPIDLNQLTPVLSYSESADWESFYLLRMPSSLAYHQNGLKLDCLLSSPTGAGTSGNLVLAASFKRLQDGVDDFSTSGFGAEKTTTVAAPNPTQSARMASLTFLASEIDNIVADDWFLLRIRRLGTNASDTMTGRAHLVAAELREA